MLGATHVEYGELVGGAAKLRREWTLYDETAIWKQILKDYEAPPIDSGIEEELRDFVERRKAEGGAPTDF